MDAAREPFEQLDEYLITDLDTFKLLAHPVRFKVLGALTREPRTVKQLAALLDMPPTRLYRHINVLLAQHLIAVVRTQVVSGIIERQYQSVARTFLSPRAPVMGEHVEDRTVQVVFDATTRAVERAVSRATEAGVIDLDVRAPHPAALLLRRAEVRLSPTRASQLSRTLVALLGSIVDEDEDSDPEGEAAWYHVLIGLYPTVAEGAERPTRLPAVAGDRDKEG